MPCSYVVGTSVLEDLLAFTLKMLPGNSLNDYCCLVLTLYLFILACHLS